MTDQVRVQPRPGLILDGIPPEGAAIDAALANEWLANRMVVPAQPGPTVVRRLGRLVPTGVVSSAPAAPRPKSIKPRRTRSDKGKTRAAKRSA